ncbi:hypothetical protein ACOB87_44165 [Streptomyces sp. YS-B37]|uniref:hypothetical protein n=1 Tax=Streptomyces sp. YS-B37 TaxID=3407669 RepID=UPI003B509CF9
MTNSPTDEPNAGAAPPSETAADPENPAPTPADNAAVAKARALAASRTDKARSALIAKNKMQAWALGAVAVVFGTPGLWVIATWYISGLTHSATKLYHGASWGVGLAFFIVGASAGVTIPIRRASNLAEFEAVDMSGDFAIRMAELDTADRDDAPLVANRALLEEYHRLSTSQAKSAFLLAQWVMGASALLVSAGAVAVGIAPKTATAVTLAALTAFVTALSGYISATLLATYRVSVEQARFYFREPLAGGYLLAAERLANRLKEPERAAALGRVVNGLIEAGTNSPGAQQDPAPQDTEPSPPAL